MLDPITPNLQDNLFAFASTGAATILAHHPKEVSTAALASLDDWYGRDSGQSAMLRLFDLAWERMAGLFSCAVPGHDARHAGVKIPAAAIEYIVASEIAGSGRLGIFAALMRSFGQSAEQRIFGRAGSGVLRARLATVLASETLAAVDMPDAARGQILHAVSCNPAGATPFDSPASSITVAAARAQSYGAERVIRLMHRLGNDHQTRSVYGAPGSEPSVLGQIVGTRRMPGPLFSRDEHMDSLRAQLFRFALIAEDEAESRQRFSEVHEIHRGTPFIHSVQWRLAHTFLPVAHDPGVELRRLLDAPNLAPDPTFIDAALARLYAAPVHLHERLSVALSWMTRCRTTEDARQARALADHSAQFLAEGDLVMAHICAAVRALSHESAREPVEAPAPSTSVETSLGSC